MCAGLLNDVIASAGGAHYHAYAGNGQVLVSSANVWHRLHTVTEHHQRQTFRVAFASKWENPSNRHRRGAQVGERNPIDGCQRPVRGAIEQKTRSLDERFTTLRVVRGCGEHFHARIVANLGRHEKELTTSEFTTGSHAISFRIKAFRQGVAQNFDSTCEVQRSVYLVRINM